ncbi:hypothetical protein ACVBKF_26030, partial [Shewanella sp. 0m-11]
MNNQRQKNPQTEQQKSFVDVFKKLSRSELKLKLYSQTANDVERALHQAAGNLDSLLALLSP